jgi:uncharacterized damage-inducible protein DinB
MATWREIVASSLGWEQAHAGLDRSVDGLAPELRGRRPDHFPHSVWELLEHIRFTQNDLLSFCTDPKYKEPHWPDDYWPKSPAPRDDAEWKNCLTAIKRDREALEKFTKETDIELTDRVPHGTGQTYLRTVLVAMDHTSHHVGQIIAVRRLLGAWPGG